MLALTDLWHLAKTHAVDDWDLVHPISLASIMIAKGFNPFLLGKKNNNSKGALTKLSLNVHLVTFQSLKNAEKVQNQMIHIEFLHMTLTRKLY